MGANSLRFRLRQSCSVTRLSTCVYRHIRMQRKGDISDFFLFKEAQMRPHDVRVGLLDYGRIIITIINPLGSGVQLAVFDYF